MSASRLPVRSVPRVWMRLTATAACAPPAGPGPGVRKVQLTLFMLAVYLTWILFSHGCYCLYIVWGSSNPYSLGLNGCLNDIRIDASNQPFFRGTFLSSRKSFKDLNLLIAFKLLKLSIVLFFSFFNHDLSVDLILLHFYNFYCEYREYHNNIIVLLFNNDLWIVRWR